MGALRNGILKVHPERPRLPHQLRSRRRKACLRRRCHRRREGSGVRPYLRCCPPGRGYKRLSLTDIKVEGVARGARKKTVDTAWTAEDIDGQWAATAWGKKCAACKAKATANDFDRFQAMVAKKKACCIKSHRSDTDRLPLLT